MVKKVCVVTGTRAEYGQLYWLMKKIQDDPALELQVIATGMHLSSEFGYTFHEIENDGFYIDKKVEMLLSADTPSAISKSTGLGMIGFAVSFGELQPDIVIVLGDRFELLAASVSALFARIPIGHIAGGETTTGAFDEAIRHSITKMAWWHFVCASDYQKRVIQLGENPDRIFLVGGLGVDGIKKTHLFNKKELERKIGFKFGEKNVLVTFHPVTLEHNSSQKQFSALLSCLEDLGEINIIFTKANSDTDGRIINTMIDEYVAKHNNQAIAFTSLGQLNYLSTMQFVDGVVGNSSSGLSEAPTFKIGTINIGDRQKGRLKANSIIDCEPIKQSILKAFEKLYSPEFQNSIENVINPYGNGGASRIIVKILESISLDDILKKEFHDLEVE